MAGVDQGVMPMRGYSTFPKGLEPSQQMQFNVISRTLILGGSHPSAELQSACSRAPAD